MKLFVLLTAAVVAAATLTTAASAPSIGAAVKPVATRLPAPMQATQHQGRSTAAKLRDDRNAVAYFRGRTWTVQRRIPVRPTPTNYAERHTRSLAFLHWLKHRWNVRWHKAKHFLATHRLPLTNDWATAVRIVQRAWPGTADWLLSCSSGEGGHGGWVWNGSQPYSAGGAPTTLGGYRTPPAGSSGAGGWMQFMLGTYAGKFRAALSEARRRHLPLPRVSSWVSPIGQAFAAGWARYHHATSAWDPGIDPACA